MDTRIHGFALFTGGRFHDCSHDQDISLLSYDFALLTGGSFHDCSHDQDSTLLSYD